MGDYVPAAVSHQVIGPIRLHRRMDRSTNASAPRLVKLMDNLHRWLQARFGSRSRCGPRITTRGQDALRLAYAICKPLKNEAEYEAVLHGMRMAKACGATRIKIHGDSNLITQQVMKKMRRDLRKHDRISCNV
jgi:hypothetical protein